ncbi:MAG: serine hydrolase [Candidatus Eremiobacteraeota bacterium]|nr:serine hydrolase [Candidatus Eremiobacteraeota bacterium]
MKRIGFLQGALAFAVPRGIFASSLQAEIERAALASTGTVGVFARSMAPGPAIEYHAGEPFPTASVIKLVILVALYRRAERDPGLLSRQIVTPDSEVVDGSPLFNPAPHDAEFSVMTLARAMIDQSDNTASNRLIDVLGFEQVNETARACGLHDTTLKRHFMDVHAMLHHSENVSTPRDIGTLLYQIERGWREGLRTVASPRSCRHMIDILLGQEDRDKIVRGLPPGVPVANKTGEITNVRNDAAIVDPLGGSPYILVVFTKDLGDFSLGVRAIRRIARAVHEQLYVG